MDIKSYNYNPANFGFVSTHTDWTCAYLFVCKSVEYFMHRNKGSGWNLDVKQQGSKWDYQILRDVLIPDDATFLTFLHAVDAHVLIVVYRKYKILKYLIDNE